MTLTVYADFDCPDAYLASRRASALIAAGVTVEWRAVQCRRARPVVGVPISAQEQGECARRFEMLDALLLPGETLPRAVPTAAPNTEAAISAYAEAYGTVVADDVRRLLFDLYWTEGADIGDPNALRTPLAGPMLRADAGSDSMRQVGYAVSVNGAPITGEAHRRISTWREQWLRIDGPALPCVLVGGATLSGVDAVRRLGKEILYRCVDANPELGDARRYPTVAGRPPLAWVSQIGGRWRHIYHGPAHPDRA